MPSTAHRRTLFVATLLAASLGVGCVVGDPESVDDQDEGKTDEWNDQNDPANFGNNFVYDWDELRQVQAGASKIVPWPDTYWPMTEDGYNARWRGSSTPSPVELYDQAFNSWRMPDGFMKLRPYTSHGTPYDKAYYDGLGPAATWAHRKGGNYRARQIHNPDGRLNACDSNNDNQIDGDASRCDFNGDGEVDSSDEEGGLEGWFGHCHAWAPASFSAPEPQHAVTVNNVTFEVADIKALIEATYEGCGGTLFLGGRCNLREMTRDEYGRVVEEDCRDTNAGAFHVVLTNVVGRLERSFVADITSDYQVWNHPLRDFSISLQEEVPEAEACRLIGRNDTQEYPYNADASRFVHVKVRMRYVVEGSASAEPYIPRIDSFTRSRDYEYVLELDADGNILGGEWISRNAPDFLWAPTRSCDARDGSGYRPVVTAANVQTLIDMATGQEPPPPAGNERSFDATLAAPLAIPDNNRTGVSNTINVPDSLTVVGLRVSVNITHTYIGDLRVTLERNGRTVVLHDRAGGGQDNLVRSFTVDGFNGQDARGDWTLKIVDLAGQDVGGLNSWQLTAITR